ncbi:MAG: hypothetical protein IRY92_06225, partial [Dactylosporangium sp.]|nr:hypothetical protein [Dactylosporangium sp.]
TATERSWDRVAQDQLAASERRLADLLAARARVAEQLAGVPTGSVLALPTAPTTPDPRGLPARLGLTGLAGLALGVSLVTLGEARRTRLSTAAASSRPFSEGEQPARTARHHRHGRTGTRQT